jgi:hypothetical protein
MPMHRSGRTMHNAEAHNRTTFIHHTKLKPGIYSAGGLKLSNGEDSRHTFWARATAEY